MTIEEKALAVLRKIHELSNEDYYAGEENAQSIAFGPDWGDGLTVFRKGTHSHVGWPKCTFEQTVDSLYTLLCEGKGLSFS